MQKPKKPFIFLSLLTLLFTVPANAKPNHSSPDRVPGSIQSGTRYYEGGLPGIQDYMDDLAVSNPSVYEQLKPDFDRLKSKDTTAKVLGYSLGVSGLILAFVGVAGDVTKSSNLIMVVAGSGIVITGTILSLAIMPTERDINQFINRHNTVNPEHELHPQTLKISLSPVLGGAGAFLTYNF